ncbi:hypothetical protein [Candidatus Nephthysia bennettiae]|uniref:hypothetical protein n=1 Tax=Candidatus Nephthysia bennettiae TaxID=3127016 RepID=UPI0030C75E72
MLVKLLDSWHPGEWSQTSLPNASDPLLGRDQASGPRDVKRLTKQSASLLDSVLALLAMSRGQVRKYGGALVEHCRRDVRECFVQDGNGLLPTSEELSAVASIAG